MPLHLAVPDQAAAKPLQVTDVPPHVPNDPRHDALTATHFRTVHGDFLWSVPFDRFYSAGEPLARDGVRLRVRGAAVVDHVQHVAVEPRA